MPKLLFEILQLDKKILAEIGDFTSIKPFPYLMFSGKSLATFRIDHPDGKEDKVSVQLEDETRMGIQLHPEVDKPHRVLNIGFKVNHNQGQGTKADFGLLVRIYKTLCEIANEMIIHWDHKVRQEDERAVFTFFSFDKKGIEGTDPQKDKLYELLIRKYLPKNFRMGKAKMLHYIGFYITNEAK